MTSFFDKRKKEVEAYIRPVLDEDETLEIFTIGQSPRFLVEIFLFLLSAGTLWNYPSSTLICLTSKRLIICRAFMLGGHDKLSIASSSEPSEIINVPFSEINRIQFRRGILVGKLIVDIREKGELQYGFASWPPARRARTIASMITSVAN